jgi:HAMP domain-containing protein
MGLRLKILSGFLILSAMLFVAGAWSIREVASVGTSVQKILDDNYKSINAAKMMIEALERQDSGVLLLLSGKWGEGRSIIQSADQAFLRGFHIAKNNITVPGEEAQIEDIQSRYKAYKDLWMQPISGTKVQGDLNWYFEGIHQAFMDAKASVDKLMALNDRTMYRTASDLKERAHRATMPGVVAILAALIFSLVFNYFIHIYVVNPIISITRGIQRFLETREPFQVQVETRDEIARLASSLSDLLAQIRAGREPR